MKVLFAVSNEEISESIVKKYQKEYKQIISYKNVYYFNAILKEIQKDKTYDRIVISEDLESFTNTQYDQIDKFIFDKLDSISDEASNMKGTDTPIILICADRRAKSEQMLVKLFGIGIYDAIIGNDRSVEEVCRLVNRPRSKKEAKAYYKIDSEQVDYKPEDENDVTEMEIQNIVAYYKRLGKNEEKYVDAFKNIAGQYNDTQLRIISKFLPLNVRAVLEEQSQEYQQIMSFNNSVSNVLRKNQKAEKTGPSEVLLKPKNKENVMSRPVVIPSSVNLNSDKKMTRTKKIETPIEKEELGQVPVEEKIEPQQVVTNNRDENISTNVVEKESILEEETQLIEPVKRGRGRPRKNPVKEEVATTVKRGRGRPRKNETQIPEKEKIEDNILPGFEDDDGVLLPGISESEVELEDTILPGFEEIENDNEPENFEGYTNYGVNLILNNNVETNTQNYESTIDLSDMLTPDKKLVSFVGTSKNGTSFIVNNIAELMSSMGISTAILDTTKNRNSYYIYTKNEEQLRNIATQSIRKLTQGIAEGIIVNKNLTVYTSLPDEDDSINQVDQILETLVRNYQLVLIDTDFNTPYGYFKQSQEIYLVQSLDILTIQPLTAFLKELKQKNILDEKKLRIILNKTVKIRGITDKTIIGGMAFYNDPAMSFMTELFDRNMIKYVSIPFDEEVYIIYLESIINCNISLKGYSKMFMQTLKELGNMVYPIVAGKSTYRPLSTGYNQGNFSKNMNNTLNQMKRNY